MRPYVEIIELPVVLQLVWNDGETQGMAGDMYNLIFLGADRFHSLFTNILQKVRMNRVYNPTVPPERRRFVAGSILMNGRARSSGYFPDVAANA